MIKYNAQVHFKSILKSQAYDDHIHQQIHLTFYTIQLHKCKIDEELISFLIINEY